MTPRQRGFRRIRSQLVWRFSLVSMLTVFIFSLFNFLFVYAVEDVFFDRLVEDERQFMIAALADTGTLPRPRQSFFRVSQSVEALPADVRAEFLREPDRPEYAGADGRHYHLAYNDEPRFILLAEVSEYLVVRKFRSAIFTLLIAAAVILLLTAIGIAVLVGNRLARPIEALARLFEKARASELPTGFAADFPNNEIGLLARGMEQAVVRINAFIKREQHFTRDVSHELRTPVAVMKGALEVLTRNRGVVDLDILRRMESAIRLMEQNIEMLLALGREAPSRGAGSSVLLPVVESAVIDNAALLDGRSVDVEVDVDARFSVPSPRGMIQILLNNLVSNAFQHTREGRVCIRTESPRALVISDTGSGIDPSIESELFSPYVKGENSAGFGVGLSIVRRLCEHQGWDITLDSSEAGTRVTVVFPS